MQVHGNLTAIFGIGTLILGKSGIGKSECALELIQRGHRLIADDLVELRKDKKRIFGSGPELTKHLMEIRGLGLIDVKALFGVASVMDESHVQLIVKLLSENEAPEIDRLGLEQKQYSLLSVSLPVVEIPLFPQRNPATLVEVAVRNLQYQLWGRHTAKEFCQKQQELIQKK